MVKPTPNSSQNNNSANGVVIKELVASVRSNVDVVRDAMKEPANEDSHAIVSDLMLEIKQSQDVLQKRASELADTGQFDDTNEIFETIDLVTNLEPDFERWSRPAAVNTGRPAVGDADEPLPADEFAEVDAAQNKKKKKKKKKKRESGGEDDWGATETNAQVVPSQPANVESVSATGGWEAFPAPPGETVPVAPSGGVAPVQSTPPTPAPMQAASGRLTLGMTWDTIGPLIGDPGSSDEVRKLRLGELVKEAIANECGVTLDRIQIKSVS
jgi:hypothetical protein